MTDVPGDVVHHQRSRRSSVVAACDGSEALLTRRVPDLQLDLLTADLDDPGTELHADGVRTVGHDCS